MNILFLLGLVFGSLHAQADTYQNFSKYNNIDSPVIEGPEVISPQKQMLDSTYEKPHSIVEAFDYSTGLEPTVIEDNEIEISCKCQGINNRTQENISIILSDIGETEEKIIEGIEIMCMNYFTNLNQSRIKNQGFDLSSEVSLKSCN